MGTVMAFAARSALRNRPVLLPAFVVLVVAMAVAAGLAALIAMYVGGGRGAGGLGLFLGITVAGLVAVSISVFAVVRTAFDPVFTKLDLLGAPRAAAPVFMGTQAVLVGLLASLVGAVLAPVLPVGLTTLMGTRDNPAYPLGDPAWPVSLAAGAAVTVALACLGAVTARRIKDPDTTTAQKASTVVRALIGLGVLVAAVLVMLSGGVNLSALGGGMFLTVPAVILLAGPLMRGIAWAIARAGVGGPAWPTTVAARGVTARGKFGSATVGAVTVGIYACLMAMALGGGALVSANIAEQFSPTAALLLGADGRIMAADAARHACDDAGTACSGVVWVPPAREAKTPAVADRRTASALLAPGSQLPQRFDRHDASLTGPWPQLDEGTRPSGAPDWRGLPVVAAGTAGSLPARDWARVGSSEDLAHGSGTADIAPMLSPLLLLGALFAAAAVFTDQASRGSLLTTLRHLGEGSRERLNRVAAGVSVLVAAVYGVAWIAWLAIRTTVAANGSAAGLTGVAVEPFDALFISIAACTWVVLFGMGVLGSRSSEHLAL